jgi:hypothetical protein
MSGKPILVFATVALLIAGVTVAMTVGGTHHPGTPAPAASQPATTGRTTIDAIAGETFTSAPGAKSRRTLLKPMAALRHFYGKAAHMSAGVNVQLGYLTLPPGTSNGLVYAFTAHSCGPNPEGRFPPPTPTPTPDPTNCTQWAFLDAVTGKMIDTTWTD